ncbi:asparagine synthase-related protein [Winogradskyella sediminis]|uniref:asparagine synthase-related protein n=1 Tax=Winogradskyella sediminis TaxID=1382466 RepID=UPI000E28167B|nr:asparagine synthase-related protein [Winogradskyella sediminis]REG87726.1 asparagine synthase [Winogradskyella sediminis]
MKTITTPIIPIVPTYAKVNAPHELHLEAICVFAAIGFFLDTDTYWKDEVVLRPGCQHTISDDGYLLESIPWFEWHYTPDKTRDFDATLQDFTTLFESIIEEQTVGKKVILPLSGGLDSRTQAAALQHLKASVTSYSYDFQGGYKETEIAKSIAEVCDFDFTAYTIPKGYLWDVLEDLATLNRCESDFTAPRQMAIVDEFETMGEVFSLGHWGDVLFDDMGVRDDLPLKDQVKVLQKKLIKKGGRALANQLWSYWNLAGDFDAYFETRITSLLSAIKIPNNANARIRAFKSMYWAPRWTSVNLAVFASKHPVTLPYYDKRMCEFICTVPESFLAKRQLQIGYIKKRAPKLAKITWQEQRPFNLYTYPKNKTPYNLPYRTINKLERVFQEVLGKKYIERNWELQFLGDDNQKKLEAYVYNTEFNSWISKSIVDQCYNAFKSGYTVEKSHAMNMFLVFAVHQHLNKRHA